MQARDARALQPHGHHACCVERVSTNDKCSAAWTTGGAKEIRKARQEAFTHTVIADDMRENPISTDMVAVQAHGLLQPHMTLLRRMGVGAMRPLISAVRPTLPRAWDPREADDHFSELYSGSIIPSASHCATLTNSEVSLQFDYRLYDLGPQGAGRNVTRESVNDCGSLPSINPQPPGCVPTLSTTAYFETQSTRIPFVGAAPITVPDPQVNAITGTPVVIDVLANDLPGDSVIDPATVQLLVPTTLGTTSINPTTGEITYTATASNGFDYIYYRVRDVNNNLSTFSKIDIVVDAPVAIAADVQAMQNSLVSLDGSASTDDGTIVGYQWTQISGTPVALSDRLLANPTFTSPIYSLLTGETLQFALTVTDNDGLQSSTLVDVTVLPVSPQDVYAVEELALPFQFGVDVGGAIGYRFETNNTGVATNSFGSYAFNW